MPRKQHAQKQISKKARSETPRRDFPHRYKPTIEGILLPELIRAHRDVINEWLDLGWTVDEIRQQFPPHSQKGVSAWSRALHQCGLSTELTPQRKVRRYYRLAGKIDRAKAFTWDPQGIRQEITRCGWRISQAARNLEMSAWYLGHLVRSYKLLS